MALEVIQLANYQRPEIKESASKDWVLNGYKNSFYQDIIDSYNGSPTNSAIIDGYAQFIYGKGLTSPQKTMRPTDWAFILSALSKSDLRKICKDFEMFGEASAEVIYKNGKVSEIVHVAKQRIAPAKANEDGDIDTYFYSYDFSKESKYKPEPMPAFGYGEEPNRSEIFVFKDYQVGQFYYANPSWVSAIAWAKLEEEISNYCVNHIKNGLSFGHVINMNSGVQESEETAQIAAQRIREKLTGSQNAGKFFINFNDNKDNAISIEALEVSNAHEQYMYLSAEAKHQLMTAHRLTSPLLVGVKEGSGFSSNADELTVAFDELMTHVIQPKQEIILDGLMNIFAVNGISLQLEFIPLNTEEEIATDGMTNDAAISYNGAQITSAIDIFAKVKEGILTVEQAIVFLIQFLNIPADVAKSLFTAQPAPITQLSKKKIELESYTDYPKEASENAKIALRWAEENGWGDCGTAVGKQRAHDLANNRPLSRDVISRMASFERHRQNSDKELGDGCGRLMWLAWGGDAGIEWAQRKLTQLKSQDVNLVAEPLIELGEEIDLDEWEEIDSVPVNESMELNEISLSLAKTFSSFPNATSEQDTMLFKVRYVYAGNQDPEREFCKKVMRADKVYRKEDIILAGDKVVNAGLGPYGSDTYSIWLYKGGVNCNHFWERKIYLRRNNKAISVNEARRMILELDPADRPLAKWQENDPLVAQSASESNNYFRLQ